MANVSGQNVPKLHLALIYLPTVKGYECRMMEWYMTTKVAGWQVERVYNYHNEDEFKTMQYHLYSEPI